MKIYKLESDNSDYNGLYTTGVCYIPEGYDFHKSIDSITSSYDDKLVAQVEDSQNFIQEPIRNLKLLTFYEMLHVRIEMFFGPGNHKFIEVFDTNNP